MPKASRNPNPWRDVESDPRVRRTRHSVIDAFAGLARERSYDTIRVEDVVQGAAVGRSTFYAHYRGKDDVLIQALSMFYEMLAEDLVGALHGEPTPGRLEAMLEHFVENRLLARRLTTGPAAEAYARSLTAFGAMIATRLEQERTDGHLASRVPPALLGTGLAHALMAMILDWLNERPAPRCSAEDLAFALRAFFRGSLAPEARPGATGRIRRAPGPEDGSENHGSPRSSSLPGPSTSARPSG